MGGMPFWAVGVLLPLALVVVWMGDPRETVSLGLAGFVWLLQWRSYDMGFRRVFPRIGVVIIALLLALVWWLRRAN